MHLLCNFKSVGPSEVQGRISTLKASWPPQGGECGQAGCKGRRGLQVVNCSPVLPPPPAWSVLVAGHGCRCKGPRAMFDVEVRGRPLTFGTPCPYLSLRRSIKQVSLRQPTSTAAKLAITVSTSESHCEDATRSDQGRPLFAVVRCKHCTAWQLQAGRRALTWSTGAASMYRYTYRL